MITRILFVGFFILFHINGVFGQSGLVRGRVQDMKSKQGIPGALIVPAGQNKLGTQADADGNYQLELPAGTYTLEIKSIGYEDGHSRTFLIRTGETEIVDIALKEKIRQLGTFVTSASKYEQEVERITMTVDVLRPNIIENKNTTAMKDALQQIPGVSIVNNEPQIRSGSGFSFGAG